MTNNDKRAHIQSTAIKMVGEIGLINLTRAELCKRAGIPDGSFLHVMGCSFSEFIKSLDSGKQTNERIRQRVSPVIRKDQLLSIAVKLAITHGYNKVTRAQIAEVAGVVDSLVTKYFGTMIKLRRDIMRTAIRDEIPEVIAQGLINKDPHARKATDELKELARASL